MSLLGAVVRRIDPKTAINYFRRNLMGSGELGRKQINEIKGKLKNLSQEDRERLQTADLEDLTPAEVDLVMFGFVGFKDFGMPNKTIAQMKGNEFTTFKNKLNKIVDDTMLGKDKASIPEQAPTQTTLFNKGGGVSMLKPDFKDLDGDGNKTEPMKTAAKQRDNMAEGGNIDGQMAMLMIPKEPEEDMMPEEDMLPDNEMEDEYLDFILDEALDSEEEDYLMSQLQSNEQLSEIFDKVIDVAQEFAGSGPVEGPGSGVSDSIPARLSDGEFVFTAKAVEEIGADNLMAMMKDAEMKADDRQGLAEGGEPEEDTVEMEVEKPATKQDIRVVKTTVDNGGKGLLDEDEISKSIKSKMMLDNRTGRHVQS
jgi:hypothetical protein